MELHNQTKTTRVFVAVIVRSVLSGNVLGLFGREALEEDANAGAVWSGNGGIALAFNLPSEAEVAGEIGARVLKQPQKAFWGGYHGFFADRDGHVWEVAYNPFFPVDRAGVVTLP